MAGFKKSARQKDKNQIPDASPGTSQNEQGAPSTPLTLGDISDKLHHLELTKKQFDQYQYFLKLVKKGKLKMPDSDPDSSDTDNSDDEDERTDNTSDEEDENDYKILSKAIIFNGNNYPIWKRYIRGTFSPKKLWKITIGKEKRPKDPSMRKKWDKKDMAASTALLQSCASEIHEQFLTHDTAFECWSALQNLYEKGFASKSSYVFKEWMEFKMKNDEVIDNALKRFNILIEQLNSLNKFPPEDEKLFVFLNGLPPRFSVSKEVIDARETPSFSFAINHLKTTEMNQKRDGRDSRANNAQQEAEMYGFGGSHGFRRGRGRGNQRGGSSVQGRGMGDISHITCFRCSNKGHYSSDCPQNDISCYTCGQKGHTSAQCRGGNSSNGPMFEQTQGQRGRGGRGRFGGRGGSNGRGDYGHSYSSTWNENDNRGYNQTNEWNYNNNHKEYGQANEYTFNRTEQQNQQSYTEQENYQIQEPRFTEYHNCSFTMNESGMETAKIIPSPAATNDWIIDTGATHHLCSNEDAFVDLRKLTVPKRITVASGHKVPVEKVGTIQLELPVQGNGGRLFTSKVRLHNVLYMPGGSSNLLSVPQIQIRGGRVTCLETGKIHLTDTLGRPFGEGFVTDTLKSKLRCKGVTKENPSFHSINGSVQTNRHDLDLWHYRLGHTSEQTIKEMIRTNAARGLEYTSGEKIIACAGCSKGRPIRKSHPLKDIEFRSNAPLDLLHIDLCGPVTPATIAGNQYLFVLVDDYSRKTWVYLITHKDDAVLRFQEFVVMVERESGRKVKAVRSDNGTEFKGGKFGQYCTNLGIRQQFTSTYSPSSNGVAERKNRTLQEMARSMLASSRVPLKLWGDAIHAANYTCNRRLTSVSQSKTPHELYYGRRPTISHMRIWGCDATVFIENRVQGKKFDERSWKGTFVGYSRKSTLYRVYNPNTNKIIESRNVDFHEDLAKFKNAGNLQPKIDFPNIAVPQNSELDSDNEYDEIGPSTRKATNLPLTTLNYNHDVTIPPPEIHIDAEPIANPTGHPTEPPVEQIELRKSTRSTRGQAPIKLTYPEKGKIAAAISFLHKAQLERDLA
jgi:transposase InsO family protein